MVLKWRVCVAIKELPVLWHSNVEHSRLCGYSTLNKEGIRTSPKWCVSRLYILKLSGYETRVLDAFHSAVKPRVSELIFLLKVYPHACSLHCILAIITCIGIHWALRTWRIIDVWCLALLYRIVQIGFQTGFRNVTVSNLTSLWQFFFPLCRCEFLVERYNIPEQQSCDPGGHWWRWWCPALCNWPTCLLPTPL